MPLSHLTTDDAELIASAASELDPDADYSASTSSPGALFAAMRFAIDGVTVSPLTTGTNEMLAGIWNALEPGAGASHLTMDGPELLAGIWNALDVDADASHLTMSVGELLAGIANASLGGLGPSISLSASSIEEGAAAGTLVGTFSVVNGSGTYTFTLTDDAGTRFAIDGNDLEAGAVATDFETATSHSITVEADNGVDPVISDSFTITVTNVAEGAEGTPIGLLLLLTKAA